MPTVTTHRVSGVHLARHRRSVNRAGWVVIRSSPIGYGHDQYAVTIAPRQTRMIPRQRSAA